MMDIETKNTSHLRMVAVKTTIITVAAVAGMLVSALLLNIFMLGA